MYTHIAPQIITSEAVKYEWNTDVYLVVTSAKRQIQMLATFHNDGHS